MRVKIQSQHTNHVLPHDSWQACPAYIMCELNHTKRKLEFIVIFGQLGKTSDDRDCDTPIFDAYLDTVD